jgi:hypothetical protein
MGADFIERISPSYRKSMDRARARLATSDLLANEEACAARTAVADIVDGQSLRVGDRITVELEDGQLVGRRGFTEVARFTAPPSDLLKAVEDSCGVAKGTVEQVHDIAGVAEISLC